MPFTLSHAAAIIPFHRKPFVLSALITGSLSPDLLYFIPFFHIQSDTHTFSGLFLFCLPASLFMLFTYHYVLKHPLVSLLPWQVQIRITRMVNEFRLFPVSQFFFVTLSILLGALTHIVWDSFTHATGQSVMIFSFLRQPVFSVAGESIVLYKLLQYISTVLGGLLFTTWFCWRVWQEEPAHLPKISSSNGSQYWLLLMVTASGVTGLIYGWLWSNGLGFKSFVVQTAIGSMTVFFVLLLLFSFACSIRDNSGRNNSGNNNI